jgi:hypothetical protein
MTTPGMPGAELDEQVLNDFMSRAAGRWGGSRGPCRWITTPSETTRKAAAPGFRSPEAKEAGEAVGEVEKPAEEQQASPVPDQAAAERPTDERGDEAVAGEAVKAPEATRAKAARPARPRRAKKAEAPRPARTRGTKKR